MFPQHYSMEFLYGLLYIDIFWVLYSKDSSLQGSYLHVVKLSTLAKIIKILCKTMKLSELLLVADLMGLVLGKKITFLRRTFQYTHQTQQWVRNILH